jgi:hypothetical protein
MPTVSESELRLPSYRARYAGHSRSVKECENLDGAGRAGATECRRQNRSARPFTAEPAGNLKCGWTEDRNSH